MQALQTQVESWIRAHRLLAPGDRVAAAVSGGADSTALLLLLAELAPRWGWQLSVVHYDHGWRPDSAADAAFVAHLAARLGLEFHHRRAPAPPPQANREQLARRLRYGFFQELAAAGAARRFATAHTADDQAETVLLRLLRGAGPAGLCGILPSRPLLPGAFAGVLVRPLLPIPRAALRAWLIASGQEWREDSTNLDPAGRRNRLRLEVLPLLRERFNPRLEAALVATAEVARAEEEFWAARLAPLADRLWRPHPQGLAAPRAEFLALPLALRRRLLREGVRRLQGDLRRLSFEAVEAVLAALSPPARPRRYPLASLTCRVTSGRVELVRPSTV